MVMVSSSIMYYIPTTERSTVTIYRDTTDLDTSTEITLLIEGSEEETVWIDGDYRDGSATNIQSEVNRLEQSAKTVNKELGLSTQVYIMEHYHSVDDGGDCECSQWALDHKPHFAS